MLPSARAQSSVPDQRRGSNYDPPPVPKREYPPAPPEDPDAGKPLFALQELDWTDKETWLKMALLVGSIVLARRAFRQMKEQ